MNQHTLLSMHNSILNLSYSSLGATYTKYQIYTMVNKSFNTRISITFMRLSVSTRAKSCSSSTWESSRAQFEVRARLLNTFHVHIGFYSLMFK